MTAVLRVSETWHWFALEGAEPRPMFSFAGIWQRWRGPLKKDGPNVEIDVFSFMTTVPNTATGSINHERSPVILTTDEERNAWLQGSSRVATRASLIAHRADKLDRSSTRQSRGVGLEGDDEASPEMIHSHNLAICKKRR